MKNQQNKLNMKDHARKKVKATKSEKSPSKRTRNEGLKGKRYTNI